jgi:peptidoglycan/LPS O-acetylase OafA/YrhL
MISPIIKTNYRPDIDGLRAIAVLSVIICHAFPSILPGGFIGVDIFFVISGYLITRIILANLSMNTFNFIEFYYRRVRRIFPPLFLVLLVSLIFGWILFTAEEYKELGLEVSYGAAFLSNFLYLSQVGYFDAAAELKPMLHLWSLAVEEQFYLLWPLILFFSHRFGVRSFFVVLCILFGSLILCFTQDSLPSSFYLPQARFWEIMVGALIATPFFSHYSEKLSISNIGSKANNFIAALGLILISIALLTIDKNTRFPGYYSFLPVVGASLIIISGPSSVIGRYILGNRFFTSIGLVSYSLYLWHWPLLSFPRILEGQQLSTEIRLLILGLSFVLAFTTYHFIEFPVRKFSNLRKISLYFLIAITGVGFSAVIIYLNQGFEFRDANQPLSLYEGEVGQIGHVNYGKYLKEHSFPCPPSRIKDASLVVRGGDFSWPGCYQSNPSLPPSIILMGDSHAEHLFLGLAAEMPDKNIYFSRREKLPLISDDKYLELFNYAVNEPSIKTIILGGYWVDIYRQNGKNSAKLLEKTLSYLSAATNKNIYVFDDVPAFSFEPGLCKFTRKFRNFNKCTESKELVDLKTIENRDLMKRLLAKDSKIQLINGYQYFCNEKNCSMVVQNKLLYRDNNHLSVDGSLYIGKQIVKSYPEINK